MRHKLRGIEVDMFVTNRLDWGHFVESHNFSISHLHNKLYEIINNCDCEWCDWEKRYLHENYTQSLDLSQPGAMCNAVPRYAIYRWHTARLWRSPTCRHMPPTIVLFTCRVLPFWSGRLIFVPDCPGKYILFLQTSLTLHMVIIQ